MNSPKKFPHFAKARPAESLLDWAKRYLLRGMLGVQPGADDPMIETLRSSIESSLRCRGIKQDKLQVFAETAHTVIRELSLEPQAPCSFGFAEIDLRDRDWTPLFLHDELIRHLRRLAGLNRVLVVFRGLRDCYQSSHRTRRSHAEGCYQQLRDDLDRIIARRSSRYATIQVIYL